MVGARVRMKIPPGLLPLLSFPPELSLPPNKGCPLVVSLARLDSW